MNFPVFALVYAFFHGECWVCGNNSSESAEFPRGDGGSQSFQILTKNMLTD